ncbi:MAG: group I truncated hemoglobin [Magnetospiraceae bacterium]
MTIYEEIGGKEAVDAAVGIFYQKVLADPLLIPFFEDVDMDNQSKMQARFFTTVFKGEASGAAEYMRKSHRHLVAEKGLNDAHFDAVAGHLHATLQELKVPDHLTDQIMTAAGSLRDAVLDR